MNDEFGGVLVEEPQTDEFGGIAVGVEAAPSERPAPTRAPFVRSPDIISGEQAEQEGIPEGVPTYQSAGEALVRPLVDLPRVTGRDLELTKIPEFVAGAAFRNPLAVGLARKTEKTSAQVLAGLQQATVGAAEFFTSPLGIATLGASKLPKLAQKGVALAFVAQMAAQSPEMINELAEAFYANDPERLTHAAASLGLNTAFIAGGLKAGTARVPKPPPLPRTIQAAREAAKAPIEPAESVIEPAKGEIPAAIPEITPAESARVERINTATPEFKRYLERLIEENKRTAEAELKQEPIPAEQPPSQPKPPPSTEIEGGQPPAKPAAQVGAQAGVVPPELRVGDEQVIMQVPSVLANTQTIGGVKWDLFNGAKLKENRAAVRVIDVESGEVLQLKQFPTYDAAEAHYNSETAKAKTFEQPAAKEAVAKDAGLHVGFAVEAELRKLADQTTPASSVDLQTGRKVIQGNGTIFLDALDVWQKTRSVERVTEFLKSRGIESREVSQRIQAAADSAKSSDYLKSPLTETVYRGETPSEAGKHIGVSVTTSKEVAQSYGPVTEYKLNAVDVLKHDQKVSETDLLQRGADYDMVQRLGENPTGADVLTAVTRWLRDKHEDVSPSSVGDYMRGLGWQAYKMAQQSFVFDTKALTKPPKEAVAPVAEAKAEVAATPIQQKAGELTPTESKTLGEFTNLGIEADNAIPARNEVTGKVDYGKTDQQKWWRWKEFVSRGINPESKRVFDGLWKHDFTNVNGEVMPKVVKKLADYLGLPARGLKDRLWADATKLKPARTTAGEGRIAPQEGGFTNLQFAQVILPKRFFQDVKSSMTKWFKIGGHLPEEAVKLRREMDAKITATDADVRNAERDLMGALKKEFGLSTVEMLGGGSHKIPPQFVQAMNEHLKGNPQNLPPEIRGVIDNMRAQITGWSDRIIDMFRQQLNQLTPGTPKYESLGKLIETIENNRDVYVHRAYKFFDSKSPAPAWYDDLPLADRMRAEDFVRNNSPTPLTPEQARSKLLDWLSDLRDEGTTGAGSKVGAKDLSIFMKRKVIAPEIRAVLGEYNSPLINYAKSVSKMARWAANQKFLEEVRRAGMGQFLFEEGANPPGFNARIAPEGSDTMSPLNGLRTSQEIAEAFKDINRVPEHGALARNYFMFNAWTKVAQTALSIMTQSRNLSSRLWMAGMAGHWNVGKAGKSLKAIGQDFAGSDPVWRAYLKDAYEHGVIGDTSRARELREIVKDAALNDVQPSDLYSWSLARAVKKVGYKIPTDIYRLSDELGNLYGWENEMVNVREIHPTWTDAQVKAEAAKIVRTIYPTYSESPRIVQQFRKNVLVGPFVNFPYQVWRNMWNAFGLSISEIRSSNPVERKIGAKRLASQVGTIAAAYAAQEFAKSTLGISTQEEEDFRRFQPPWARNSKWLFLNKDAATGELGAINLSYIDPYSYATDIVPAILSGIRGDKDPFEIFAESTRETFRPWVSEQMLLKAIVEARNGKTDRGKDIFNPTDSTFEKFNKQSTHVLKSLEPGTMQRAERRIIPAAKGEQPIYGRKLEFGPEIARELTGVAVEKFNFKNGLAFRASDFVKAEDASEDVFRRVLSQTQTTSPKDLVAAYAEANDRRFKLWKEFRGDYLAAIRRGVSDREAANLLVNRRVSRATAEAIRRGVYEPMPITDTMHDRARERKRAIPMTEIREAARAYSRRSLDD